MTRFDPYADVVAVYGRRGSGKSTRARRFAAMAPRLVVVDPNAEPAWSRLARPVADVAELRRAVARSPYSHRLVVHTGKRKPFEVAEEVADEVWQSQDVACRAGLGTLLVVDEASLCIPSRGRFQEAVNACALQGRHRLVGLVIVSQRPALVRADVRTQARASYWHDCPGTLDRRALRDEAGPDAVDLLRALPPFHAVEVTEGRARRVPPVPGGRRSRKG